MRIIPDFELNDSTIETHFSFLLERVRKIAESPTREDDQHIDKHFGIDICPFDCHVGKLNNCGMRKHNDDRLHEAYLIGFISVEVSGTRDEASCGIFIF